MDAPGSRRLVVTAVAVALVVAAAAGTGAPSGGAATTVDPCRPVRALFYAPSEWLRLAGKLAANASPCASYFVSVPPLNSDKTQPHAGQAQRIRAFGSNFHALDELNMSAWSRWVATNGSSWLAAGQEARRRMAAAGFDPNLGDTWAVNELSSSVRRGDPGARQAVVDFVRGVSQGDGTVPAVKGVVFISGIAQSTGDLSVYRTNMENWLLDTGFWSAMSAAVSDWCQESYGDLRSFAVAGASVDTRVAALQAFLFHDVKLAAVAPPAAAAAAAFLQATAAPVANAAWQWESSYGWTNVTVDQMQDYVAAQTQAMRAYQLTAGAPTDHFAFAWAPQNHDGLAPADFTAQTDALLGRLAAAIRDSAVAPAAACAPTGCSTVLPGAFNPAWDRFAAWTLPTLTFAGATPPVTTGTPAGPYIVRVPLSTGATTVTVSSSSSQGLFAPAASGPWTPTLALTVPAGTQYAAFSYLDAVPGTAQLGTVQLTAAAPGAASALLQLTVSPAPAGAPAPGSAAAPSTTGPTTTGPAPTLVASVSGTTTKVRVGGSVSFTASVANASGGNATGVHLQVAIPAQLALQPSGLSAGCAATATGLDCVGGVVPLGARTAAVRFSVTVTGTGTLVLAASAAADQAAPGSQPPRAVAMVRAIAPPAVFAVSISGRAVVGRTLHARLRAASTGTPRFVWLVCRGARCASVGVTRRSLVVHPGWRGKTIRVVARARADDGTGVVAAHASAAVHR